MDTEQAEWIASVQDVVLPEWLQECLPSPKPVYTVSWSDTGGATPFLVHDEASAFWKSFETVSEAYDAVREEDGDIVFDPTIDGHGCKISFMGVSVDSDGPYVRMLFSSTDADKLALLKSSYKTWLEDHYPSYKGNPNSIQDAYEFISNHPAFWTRRDGEATLDWETSEYMQHLWHGLSTDSGGKCAWMVEGGGHVEPDYTTHYHDLRLDAYGETFEEAIVNFAALVDKFFHIDGTPREGVEYEPSPLEVLLKERMEEVERDRAEWEAKKNEEDADA